MTRFSPFSPPGDAPETATTLPTSAGCDPAIVTVAISSATTREATADTANPFTRQAVSTDTSDPAVPFRVGAPAMPE